MSLELKRNDMSTPAVRIIRKTRETEITLELDLARNEPISISTGIPFFDHMLHAMSFHGGFSLNLTAHGDLEVDPHHLVEDTGLVLGDALRQWVTEHGAVMRFGHSEIPMDDALSRVVIDVCERPFLVLNVEWPQPCSGTFDMELFREFLRLLHHGQG